MANWMILAGILAVPIVGGIAFFLFDMSTEKEYKKAFKKLEESSKKLDDQN
ncbi:MAG: hypothetical protein AAFX54_02850 [Pseudomonadota bacterium]